MDCKRSYPGLWFVVPDAVWRAVVGRLDAGEMCPWCLNGRLAAAGLEVRLGGISLDLSHLHALNLSVINALEALDGRLIAEQRTHGGV